MNCKSTFDWLILLPPYGVLLNEAGIRVGEGGVEELDRVKSSSECVILDNTGLPLVPVLGKEIGGNKHLCRQPPSVTAFGRYKDGVAVKQAQEATE